MNTNIENYGLSLIWVFLWRFVELLSYFDLLYRISNKEDNIESNKPLKRPGLVFVLCSSKQELFIAPPAAR